MGCSSDDQGEAEKAIEKSDNIEASKVNVTPLEVVQLHSKNFLSQESYKAQFLGMEITLGKFNDTTLVFMVPQALANKEGDLTFLVQGKQEEIKFKVSALNLVANPDEEIDSFIQEMVINMAEDSDNSVLFEEYKTVFEENLAAFNTSYSTLTSEEKVLVASFLKINMAAEEAIRSNVKSDTEPCLDLMSKKFVRNVGKTVLSVGVLAAAIIVPEPALTKVAATLLAVRFVYNLHKTTNTVEMLVRCIRVKEYTSIGTSSRNTGELYKFANLQEYKVNFFGKYESLSKNDLNSDITLIKNIASQIENYKRKLSEWKTTYNSFVDNLGLPSSLTLETTEFLPSNPLISETKLVDNTKITQVSISTDKAIVKKNGLEGSDYIMSFSNKTIEKQYFDIQVEGVDDGFSAKGIFKAELEESDGKIVIQDGNEKAANENNEATVVLTVLNEEETPVENGKIELSSTSSDVSFPSGSNFTTGANGQINFKVKISKESSESKFVVVIKLKNEAGEVKNETNVTVNVDIASRLINGSPWKVTSFIQDGGDTFNEMETGNETCYPTGVFDKQRMIEATYTFTSGSATMNYIMEYRKWNCNTSSYDTSKGYQSFGHNWRIDDSTGKFVVTREGNEVAWLSIQVSGEKISLSGPHILDNGEETTWTIRIEKP